jgi:hypothetical protein
MPTANRILVEVQADSANHQENSSWLQAIAGREYEVCLQLQEQPMFNMTTGGTRLASYRSDVARRRRGRTLRAVNARPGTPASGIHSVLPGNVCSQWLAPESRPVLPVGTARFLEDPDRELEVACAKLIPPIEFAVD